MKRELMGPRFKEAMSFWSVTVDWRDAMVTRCMKMERRERSHGRKASF